MHGFTARVHKDAGPAVTVDCLWCGRRSVGAQTRQQTEWLKWLHLIPLLCIRNVFVRCSACGKDMIAKCAFADLGRISPVTLQRHLVKSQSLVGQVCIMLGVLLCWAPIVGMIPALIGFCYRNQFSRALKVASIVGLILSLLTTSLGIVAVVLSHGKG